MFNNTRGLGYPKAEDIVTVLRALGEAEMYAGMLPVRSVLWDIRKLDV